MCTKMKQENPYKEDKGNQSNIITGCLKHGTWDRRCADSNIIHRTNRAGTEFLLLDSLFSVQPTLQNKLPIQGTMRKHWGISYLNKLSFFFSKKILHHHVDYKITVVPNDLGFFTKDKTNKSQFF